MRVHKLPGPFGATVSDVDLSRDMPENQLRELIGLLHEHQILAIRNQKLDHEQYVRFGYNWGKPLLIANKAARHDGFQEIIRIDNRAATQPRSRDIAMHWHSDSSYEEVPASVTMLYGIETPVRGGETLIASAVLAYDALSEELRSEIEGLTGLHCLSGSPELPGEKFPFEPEFTALHGIQRHPLVMRHPVTGRKAIFTSGTAFGVEGYERDEGRALITRLRSHITSPEFTTSYKIEAGDIFLWDNFQVLHSATPIEYSDEEGKRRLLYRISTKGIPALCEPAVAA